MPGPVIANPIPFKYRPGTESVLDDFWTRVLRRIGTITGANDPQQIMSVAGAMGIPGGEASPAAKAVQAGAQYLEQKFPKLASYIKAYHGSPTAHPELQPGSMLTTDPAWAAGYTTQMQGGIGPEQFTGPVHAANVPIPERALTVRTLHGAEGELLQYAQKALGRPANSLREAADVVRQQFGYEAIVAKDASGKITGIIPLTATPVAEHLDPRSVLAQSIREGQPVADNLRDVFMARPASAQTTPEEVTKLTPAQENAFQQWAQSHQIRDVDRSPYDYRGFWSDKDALRKWKPGEHFPDTYKQHGHPTFSVESKYSKGDGGKWEGETYIAPDGRRINMLDPKQAEAFLSEWEAKQQPTGAAK